ncbi:MAG: hypothetical protein AMS26_10255 [Bacteroides sp. SM23_62]|nr:MAG: hypothetical protein AMS26_10255 [Bacteroides sp. SM23_62]
MVLKFRLISNEQDDFIRDIEILDDQTFFHLHEAIQDNLHFDKSQIASFFICNQQWEKEQEITLFELSEEESAKVLVMDHTKIGDFMQGTHDKMLYVFDVFNERLFFIELVEILKQDPSKSYPCCSFEKGHPPQQVYMDSIFTSKLQEENLPLADTSLDDEMFDDEDLDRLGFDQQIFDDSFPDEE